MSSFVIRKNIVDVLVVGWREEINIYHSIGMKAVSLLTGKKIMIFEEEKIHPYAIM